MTWTTTHKYCARCKTYVLREDFGVDRRTKSGLKSYCKPCEKLYMQVYHGRKREERSELEEKNLRDGNEIKRLKMQIDALQRENSQLRTRLELAEHSRDHFIRLNRELRTS